MKTVDIFGSNQLPEVNKTRTACRGFIVKDGKILICHELVDKQFFSPGGGIENDETLEACCIREVCEETGMIVAVKDPIITVNEYYEDWKYITHYFLCEAVGSSERNLTNEEIKRWHERRLLFLRRRMEWTEEAEEALRKQLTTTTFIL